MLLLVLVTVAFVAGLVLGRYLWPWPPPADLPIAVESLEPHVSVSAPAVQSLLVRGRCHTITYTYSNGATRTFHRCQGQADFSDAFGRSVAPRGTRLVSAKGGVHGKVQ